MFSLLTALSLFAAPAPANDSVAIVYVYPQDADPKTLLSKSELEQRFNGAILNFWREQSYGRYAPTATVFTWQMPITTATMLAGRQHYVVDTLKATLPGGDLAVPGYDPSKFAMTQILLGGDFIGFGGGMGQKDLKVHGTQHASLRVGSFTYFNTTSRYESMLRFAHADPSKPFVGRKNGNATKYPELGLWDSDGTLLHEWGHGLGLSSHANSWRSTVEPLYGDIFWSGAKEFWNQEYDYGNAFDIMGGNQKYALHLNAFYKDLLGWLAPAEKLVAHATQRDVRLTPLEGQTQGALKAVQLPATGFSRPAPFDDQLDYAFYVEYRRPLGFDKHLAHPYLAPNIDGLFVYMTRRKGNGFIASWLLDMSPDDIVYDRAKTTVVPNSVYNEDDNHLAALVPGKSFYDDQTGWALTNIRPDGDRGVTFDVEQGKKPGVASGVYTTALLGRDSLDRNGELRSPDLAFALKLQTDGNIVVRRAADNGFVWGSVSNGVPMNPAADKLELKDGDLVLSGAGTKLWSSNTGGNPGARLVVGADGGPRVLSAAGAVLWPKPTITGQLAACRAGVTLLQDNLYKYPSRPENAPAGKLSWKDAYAAQFKPTHLPACDAVGKHLADNKASPATAAADAVGGWAAQFTGRTGILPVGDRILAYCPNLHRSQYDCVRASDALRGAFANILKVLDALQKP